MAPTIGVNLRVTGHCNQGSRKYMEDMFSVAYQQTEDEMDLEYAYFGIFDGHGGHEAATFAKEHLMKAIVSHAGFWSDNDRDILRAIKEGFIATHYAMWRNLENWPRTQSGWPSTSGTTATIAFIRKSNVYIGHVGDSCIVLGYKDPCSDRWRGVPLTMDHKPENPAEQKRISQAGGMVLQKSGVSRVVWHRPQGPNKGLLTRSTQFDQIPFLAVARSLGDLWSYNVDSDRFVVSPEPDVSVHRIVLLRDRCLIFGTDGLWNMLSPQEAVNIVREAEANNRFNDSQDQAWINPSKCLVDSALSKWRRRNLRADNISAVTLLLDPLGAPKRNRAKPITKLNFQPNGLAICTWYPQAPATENLPKCDGLTTLTTMEQLFGQRVEIIKPPKKENPPETTGNESGGERKINVEILAPSTSKASLGQLQVHLVKIPINFSTILRSISSSSFSDNKNSVHEGEEESTTSTAQDLSAEVTTESNEASETREEEPCFSKQGPQSEENVSGRMKLRGSLVKGSDRSVSDESMDGICQKSNVLLKSLKRNGKRGKKRKTYETIKSDASNSKKLRSKSKRRHSSLIESVNTIYELGPNRRIRSEDHKKNNENEECNRDIKNDEEDRVRRLGNEKDGQGVEGEGSESEGESSGAEHDEEGFERDEIFESPQSPEENLTQDDLDERLNSSNNDSDNTPVNVNSTDANTTTNSNNNNNNNNNFPPDFTPMRLRSHMPVKTLRSRNVNLRNCDCLVIGPKMNASPLRKSLSKNAEDGGEASGSRSLSKNAIDPPKDSQTNSTQESDESGSRLSSSVNIRSHNMRLRK